MTIATRGNTDQIEPVSVTPDRGRQVRPFLILAAICVLSVVLLFLRWQVAPPAQVTLDLGDPGTEAAHFYGIEDAEGTGFRWSRTLSAVSLPALGTSQVVTITANPARPPAAAQVSFRLLVGDRVVGEYQAQPGWQSYTATVGPGFAPDVRLMVENDTFYPSAADRRRLGLAVSELAAAPRPSRLGLTWPPLIWIVVALLMPLLAYAGARLLRVPRPWAVAGAAAVVPVAFSVILPSSLALPVVAWVAGLGLVAVLLAGAWTWLEPGSRLISTLERIGSSRWELPAVGLFVAVLAVGQTWPLASRLASSLPGWPGDNFAFLYKFWWFRTALSTGQWPFFDPNSFAPFGFDLGQGEPTLTNTLPAVLIGALTDDVVAYNLLALASFVVSGLGAYLLVRELTGSRSAALLGAVAFAFCPYRMAQLAGHIQMLGTGWIAFAFYFTERTLKTRRWTQGALAGLSLGLAALSAWYYAYMVGLVLGVYVLARLWSMRRSLAPRTLLGPAVAAFAVFGVLATPVALPSLALWRQGGLSHSAKAADEHSAAPVDYLLPNELHPVWGEPSMRAHSDENIIENSLYLGLVAVSIAMAGWWLGRRRDGHGGLPDPEGPPNEGGHGGLDPLRIDAWPAWLWVLLVSLMLSLGLTLHDLGGQVQIGADRSPIPLPGQLLYDWLPFFSSMRAYARFGLLAALAVVALMGMGWSQIVRRWARRAGWLTLLALVLLVADFWTGRYAWGTTRVEPTGASEYLAAAPEGTIIEVPLTSAQSGPALFRATYYHKPIAYGYETFEPPGWRAAKEDLLAFPDDRAFEVLHDWAVRYVVVSANAYGPDWPGFYDHLRTLPQLRHIGDFPERRSWDVDPAILDARPDMEDSLAPDTFSVFEVVER